MTAKTVVVFGATGGQGGGVARELAKDSDFFVRAVTRDPSSDKAKALKSDLGDRGEVVKGDLDDVASLASVLKDAHAVFVVTNFWADLDGSHEKKQVENAVKAAKEAGIKHFVWSTLPSAKEKSNGKFTKIEHFDCKAEADATVKAAGFDLTTFVQWPFYAENMLTFFPPKKQEDGTYNVVMPMGEDNLELGAVADGGKMVHHALKNAEENNGKYLFYASDSHPVQWYCDVIGKKTGKTIKYVPVTQEQFAGFGFPGAEELAEMFSFFREVGYAKAAGSSVEEANKKYDLTSFEKWVEATPIKLEE